MTNSITSNQLSSPLTKIANFGELLLQKITKKTIQKAIKLIKTLKEDEIQFLESLNHLGYNINYIEEIENGSLVFKTILTLILNVQEIIESNKKYLDSDDKVYNEFIDMSNEFIELKNVSEKIYNKLNQIHDKILTNSSEIISSDTLDNIWEGEEELWDNFYKETASI